MPSSNLPPLISAIEVPLPKSVTEYKGDIRIAVRVDEKFSKIQIFIREVPKAAGR